MRLKTPHFIFLFLTTPLFTTDFNDDFLTNYFVNAVMKGKIAGAHVMVSKDGKIEYSKTFGYSDVETGTLLNHDAIYRIASMTKIITSIAALQLWEQGFYDLDESVERYLPVFENIGVFKEGKNRYPPPPYETEPPQRPPTIRDLFRHTAGIKLGEIGTQSGMRDWQGSLDEYVERLASIPLDSHPGTKFEYGFSIDVLGLLIEKWSGKKLDDYFKEHIFDPLKLKDTGFIISDEKLRRLANHYQFQDGKLHCEENRESSPFRKRAEALSGGGGWNYSYPGLLTSAHDWFVIMEMIRNGGIYDKTRILNKSTVKIMCSDHLENIPGYRDGLGYGLGIGVVVNGDIHGKGASNGTVFWAGAPHNTFFYIDFEKKISAAMFMQSGPFHIDDMMNEFWKRSLEMFGYLE